MQFDYVSGLHLYLHVAVAIVTKFIHTRGWSPRLLPWDDEVSHALKHDGPRRLRVYAEEHVADPVVPYEGERLKHCVMQVLWCDALYFHLLIRTSEMSVRESAQRFHDKLNFVVRRFVVSISLNT
jgi:hypothetical protein